MSRPPRTATVVLCRPDGSPLGTMPPLAVGTPWWQEVGDVVDAVRSSYGIRVVVLRLLSVGQPDDDAGGPVRYLAETTNDVSAVPLESWPQGLEADGEEPLRLPYAKPGGPAADLAWADAALTARGTPRTGPARQVRSWNLSSVWRLPVATGQVWLKVVPPFFAHEGPVMTRLDPALVPPVLGAERGRVLLGDVPGEDQWDAPLPIRLAMLRMLVSVQAAWTSRVDELLSLGAPDWRAGRFTALAVDVLSRHGGELTADERRALDSLVGDLPRRFARVAECGLPDTLVHGDFHSGNVVGTPDRLALLDWGDCGAGNPLLDQPAFTGRLSTSDADAVHREWTELWRRQIPGCNPARAGELVAPVAALRQAWSTAASSTGSSRASASTTAATRRAGCAGPRRPVGTSRAPSAPGRRPGPGRRGRRFA